MKDNFFKILFLTFLFVVWKMAKFSFSNWFIYVIAFSKKKKKKKIIIII